MCQPQAGPICAVATMKSVAGRQALLVSVTCLAYADTATGDATAACEICRGSTETKCG